ncbi:cell division protein [Bacillus sp. OxB-1]|uniref:cell division protein FtsA n=1 Tax=Bacillus sp. (strain OxB-1) TaxID=98228 RepID=UPI000582136C|nr:cell division protein FtsA [Bacillus sp. OxB-1]BAQ11785.1 cell division protein [Bacillus sp. OxB-1]
MKEREWKVLTNTLFALDIGTRSVVGIILKENGGQFHVADLVTIEHKERSMIDGQIHNILSVADVIKDIKKTLVDRHGPLKRVSVAAAGRALKTAEGSMVIDISGKRLIATEDVNRLELAAVQNAQQKLLSSDAVRQEDDYYYCVGYSVLHYKLEGEEIGSLIDQAGRSAAVDVIATFLPRVVVESLLSALNRADLEMEALTLEPIAAINVLIPPSMRRLNVALVDIGAGTSDIAITDDNTVIAYGMVPLAGDEITEELSSHYLLDFPVAENIKRQISNMDEVTITDILGFEQQIPSTEVAEAIGPAVSRLAQAIAGEMIRLNNGKSPKAVMVVGGGSLTPGLTEQLSSALDLPLNRVAIRGSDALSGVTMEAELAPSPELVTPIGIAIAAKRAPIHYMSIAVNGKAIRLFELKEMTVADALLAANIKASQLYGMPGLGMSISVNGKSILLPGEHGRPSTILVNGKEADTKDLISNGDTIEITLGQNGKDAYATVRDLLDDMVSIHATIDGEPVTLAPEVSLNGASVSLDTAVQDRDEIVIFHPRTVADALATLGKKDLIQPVFTLQVDGKTVTLKGQATEYYLGAAPISLSYIIRDGDEITIRPAASPTVENIAAELGKKLEETATVTFNGAALDLKKPLHAVILNGQPAGGKTAVKPGDRLEMNPLGQSGFTFSDIFAFTDYTLPGSSASQYKLLRNGTPIGFHYPIFGGDSLEIIFY